MRKGWGSIGGGTGPYCGAKWLSALLLGAFLTASCASVGLGSVQEQVFVSCRAYVTGLRAAALQRPLMSEEQVASVQAVVDSVGPVCEQAAEGKLPFDNTLLHSILDQIIQFRQMKLIRDAVAERDVE